MHNAEIKIPAGIDVALVCTEGKALFDEVRRRCRGSRRRAERRAASQCAAKSLDSGQQVEDRLEVVLADDVRAAMNRYGPRELVSPTPDYPIFVDRRRGAVLLLVRVLPALPGRAGGTRRTRSGFPARSTPPMSGSRLRRRWASTWSISRPSTQSARPTARDRTTRSRPAQPIRAHPGPSAAKRAGTTPSIPISGDFDAFDRFVAKANRSGLEVALDFALQASPDHPWVTEHPEWFSKRADGSIAYAENPPKKYQDIYPSTSTTTATGSTWSACGSSSSG